MALQRTFTSAVAALAAWVLLAAPGVTMHVAMNDSKDRMPWDTNPWWAALVMAAVGAYVFRRYVSPPRRGLSFHTLADSSGLLVLGAYVTGYLVGAFGPEDPYVSGLVASAICVVAGLLRRPRPSTDRATRPAPVARPTPGSAPVPGQIWYASVPFDDSSESKDRPCLVLGTGPRGVDILKITSQDKSGRPGYIRMPVAGWDSRATRDSWLELDRPRRIARSAFRRPLGVCEAGVWRQVTRRHLRR